LRDLIKRLEQERDLLKRAAAFAAETLTVYRKISAERARIPGLRRLSAAWCLALVGARSALVQPRVRDE
jgi:hypothetical protein